MAILIQQLKRVLPDLKEGEIEGILYILKTCDSLTMASLIQKTGIPRETIKQVIVAMASLLVPNQENLLKLNADTKQLDFKPYAWTLLQYSDEDIQHKLAEIRQKYFLEAKRDYDQFFATENSSLTKAKLLIDKDLVEGKTIALLGDDDLVSVTLGMLTSVYSKITVFDIDPDILALIKRICGDLNIKNVQTEVYDARNNVTKQFLASYDVVMTDPPYTSSGISLFLNRSISLLATAKDFAGKYIVLFYGNSFKSPEKTLKIQEIIGKFGLLIEDKIDKLIRYNGADSIGSASAAYILKATPFTNVSGVGLTSEIYTYENVKEEKFPFVDHFTFRLFKVPRELLLSRKLLLKAAEEFCTKHKLKVVDTKVTQFKGEGVTITFILANSNLVLHTWPEFSALHIDLLTCTPIFAKDKLLESAATVFKTKTLECTHIE